MNSGPQIRLQALQDARTDLLRTQQSLTVLPERTGGRAVVNTNASLEKVADIFQESDAYYVHLASSAIRRPGPPRDGLSRSRSARRNVRAYAQRQFFTPGPDAAASPASEALSTGDGLSALLPDAAKPLALNLAAVAKPVGDGASVHITLNVGAFVREGAGTALDISAIAVDQVGRYCRDP